MRFPQPGGPSRLRSAGRSRPYATPVRRKPSTVRRKPPTSRHPFPEVGGELLFVPARFRGRCGSWFDHRGRCMRIRRRMDGIIGRIVPAIAFTSHMATTQRNRHGRAGHHEREISTHHRNHPWLKVAEPLTATAGLSHWKPQPEPDSGTGG